MPLNPPLSTSRAALIGALHNAQQQSQIFDLLVIGGGATGLGVALDAASRGLKVVLVEAIDFAKGTSSRSTKLVHGGVRYLAQGNIGLVREALHERSTLLANAPHIAQPLAFVVPAYQWWESAFYGLGLKLYDALAGRAGLGPTRFLSCSETQNALPTVRTQGLRGGVQYWDGQFNDAQLAIALARTAAREGALILNHMRVLSLRYTEGRVSGVSCEDVLTQQTYDIQARCVVNATGVWVDALRAQDGQTQHMVAPSQGVHIVVDAKFLTGQQALMVPKTSDGRVLFAVPWLGKVILGTTDTAREDLSMEPLAFEEEVDFILREAARYLQVPPQRSDVKSIWVGLRPLVKPLDNEGGNTKGLSREHTVMVSPSGLVTVTGGKWTTYRAMAEDVLAHCADRGLLPRQASVTVHFPLVGAEPTTIKPLPLSAAPGLHSYGSEQAWLAQLPGHDVELAEGLTEAMVRFAARCEFAVHVEDVLARRSRLLFLDAALAVKLAETVGRILLEETGLDPDVEGFVKLAAQYRL